MDYDYDHLGDGIEKLRERLIPLIRAADTSEDSMEPPSWLVAALDLEEAVFCFPEAHEVNAIGRVRQAVELARRIRALDDHTAPHGLRELLAQGLEQAVGEECEALEKYMGIHVPTEVRYPELEVRPPTP